MLTEQPRKDQRIAWRGRLGELYAHCTVLRIEGNLCWCEFDKDGSRDPFIWRFHDGSLNQLAEVVT
jgi:hypothetical protein